MDRNVKRGFCPVEETVLVLCRYHQFLTRRDDGIIMGVLKNYYEPDLKHFFFSFIFYESLVNHSAHGQTTIHRSMSGQ